jgi:ABC-type polar amino acid transport system ATPase subunit
MLGNSVIELVDVCKSFKGQKVLDGINLSVDSGRITVIIGRSGGGQVRPAETHNRPAETGQRPNPDRRH